MVSGCSYTPQSLGCFMTPRTEWVANTDGTSRLGHSRVTVEAFGERVREVLPEAPTDE